MNSPALTFVIGVGLGLVAARFLFAPGNCCDRVANGVRDRVGEELGAGAVAVGDVLGIWKYTPGLLNTFGVE